MGEVYLARDAKLDRNVALKFLTRVGRLVPEHRERLRREARSLAALNHPNIVTIHDIDEVDGLPFLVLEWVPGKQLSDLSVERPLPLERFLQVATGIADGLGAAHGRGVVHRDIKPANVLFTEDGRPKLVDFGLAKLREPDEDLTGTHATVGTVSYMSPEQANGDDVGPSSDVFSFGILAYEMLTGQRPFQGGGLGAIIAAIVRDPHVPLSRRRTDLPQSLVAIVERCLQKEPQARYQSGTELAQDLRRLPPIRTTSRTTSPPDDTLTAETRAIRPPPRREQDIQFCTTEDGIRLAYSVVGSGPLLVRVLGHFTHLEMEWQWPDLRLFWERLAEHYSIVRYDGRGIGLSDSYDGDFSEESRQLDLDAVLSAVDARQAILLGISEGGWTAANYSIRHPDRVTHLVLYGAYCRGARARPNYDAEEDRALMTLIRKGWGRDMPDFRQIFTSQFFRPDADPRLVAHFNEMQRASADPETAARYQESVHQRGDGREMLQQVTTPTLVVHCQADRTVTSDEGRLLASVIPGARLVLLPGDAHYFPTDEGIVTKVVRAINRFLDESAG